MLSDLPDIPDEFIGRGAELDRLADALERRRRLVTLTGVGGVGKSRLALHAAHAVRGDRRREVIWAALWPLRDDRLLTATVADAAGFADHTAGMPLDALCVWLGDKDAVLVLDSCEHLLSSCRHLVAHLLMTCPSLTVLATSRAPLEVPGELLVTVGPLPAATDGTTLLRRRAAAAGAPLTDPADLETAGRLCAWLEGIPLALELVAGHLGQRTITIAEVERTLRSRLALNAVGLDATGRVSEGRGAGGRGAGGRGAEDRIAEGRGTDGRVVGPARHLTMRTTIGWSHELCVPVERLLWARLSVFRGVVGHEAVRAVCGGGPLDGAGLEAALSGLVAKSVLSLGAEGYRMLDTVREYGRMWLDEAGATPEIADRHAEHFLRLARDAHDDWPGPRQASRYREIGRVHADLCAALDHLLATRPGAALDLSGLVAFFWSCCGHLREAAHYVEAALRAAREPGTARIRARWALGVAHVLRGEYEAAGGLVAAGRAEAAGRQDVEGLLRISYLEGLIHLLRGRPLTARWLVDGVLDLAQGPAFASQGRIMCRLVRIFALTAEGRLEHSRREAEELYAQCVAHGEWWTRSYAAYQLALISVFEGRTEEAAAHTRSMLEGKRRLGDSFGVALGLDLLASVLAAQGAAESAVTALGAGEAYWSAVGHPQRGTPEMRHVRDRGELTARRLLGDSGYDEVLRRAALRDPESVLRDLLDGSGRSR
ncbi:MULTISPECIES: regulator [Streptomyces]|uniref:Regulator n=1 Tax=Streptomyces koelreuteriae TaxID=2838015 RepID=A0ABX8FTC9_9ACTN|nr:MULTISPECIES: regulator [Streptomyces]QWB24257.1 regulator [Streptomyces koelreuteriae]UUA07256.1 regulator [Streptomyces koelreuteriae]UUA14885.1 regulator [Streptomyces sp. CRCS-T-1]